MQLFLLFYYYYIITLIYNNEWKEKYPFFNIVPDTGILFTLFLPLGNITEGTQTNFFAVTNSGEVITAPKEAVLEGTIRKLVIEVCQENNIPLVFRLPNAKKELDHWQGAFLTSKRFFCLYIWYFHRDSKVSMNQNWGGYQR